MQYLWRRWFLVLIVVGLATAGVNPTAMGRLFLPIEIKYVAAAVLFLSSLCLPTTRLLASLRQPGPVLLALLLTAGVAPILGQCVGQIFLRDPQYRLGLVIATAVPCTLASAAIWTRLAGGHEAIALQVTLISNATVFIVTSAWLALWTRQQIHFQVTQMVEQLLIYVVLPVIVGQLLQRSRGLAYWAQLNKVGIGIVSRLCIWTMMMQAGVKASLELHRSDVLRQDAGQLVVLVAACIGTHGLLALVGYWLGRRWFDAPSAIAIAFAGSQKTLPIGLMVINDHFIDFPKAVIPLLVFHVCQLVLDTYLAEYFYYDGVHAPW